MGAVVYDGRVVVVSAREVGPDIALSVFGDVVRVLEAVGWLSSVVSRVGGAVVGQVSDAMVRVAIAVAVGGVWVTVAVVGGSGNVRVV